MYNGQRVEYHEAKGAANLYQYMRINCIFVVDYEKALDNLEIPIGRAEGPNNRKISHESSEKIIFGGPPGDV